MLKIHTQAISIVSNQEQPLLSKEQKAFNALIKKIDAKRVKLAAWQEIIPTYQRKYTSEFAPLVKTSQDIEIELVHCLDHASTQKGFTSNERHMIGNLISELAGELAAERDDAGLKELYNKHTGYDFDSKEEAAVKGMKSLFESMWGVDFGDDLDMNSPEELMKRAQAQLHERQTQRQADQQAQAERRAKRKKTAKQIAKEAQQLADEQQASQSIRDLYRKLVSALHPDREPDPQERDRKTVLMQRINQAYDNKNLLLLLELQLDLEHIDQTTINAISTDKLKHYNKILREQLNDLEHEIFSTEYMFKTQFDTPPFSRLSPNIIMRDLSTDIVGIQHLIRELKDDLLVFQGVKNVKKIKAWLKLKDMRQQPEIDFFDCPF